MNNSNQPPHGPCFAELDGFNCQPKKVFFYVVIVCFLTYLAASVYGVYTLYCRKHNGVSASLFRRVDDYYIAQPIDILLLGFTVAIILRTLYLLSMLANWPKSRLFYDVINGIYTAIITGIGMVALTGIISYIPPVHVYQSYHSIFNTQSNSNIINADGSKTILKKRRILFIPSAAVLFWINICLGLVPSIIIVAISTWIGYIDENKQHRYLELANQLYVASYSIINGITVIMSLYYCYRFDRILNTYITCCKRLQNEISGKRTSAIPNVSGWVLGIPIWLLKSSSASNSWWHASFAMLLYGIIYPSTQLAICHCFLEKTPPNESTNQLSIKIDETMTSTDFTKNYMGESLVWQSFATKSTPKTCEANEAVSAIESFNEK
ncbi:hypothetical protein BDF19DRAFT_453482 [Syncephalis fuscata]|nr:hypothetical protein BDF19DRAFT_453482 [Syncephalis fuscata]